MSSSRFATSTGPTPSPDYDVEVLADFQTALARLLVDARLRRAHGRGELALALDELALDEAELASLAAIPSTQLERAASSLVRKRRRALEATVPHCARLWPSLGQRYVELLAASPSRVEHHDAALGPGASELARLLPELRAAARADPLAPPWTDELLALELARACTARDGHARALCCRYLVHRALAALERGWLTVELDAEPCEYRIETSGVRWRRPEGA